MHNHVHKYVWVRWGWWSGGVVWGVVWGPPFLPLPLSDSPPGLCFYFYIYFYIYFYNYFFLLLHIRLHVLLHTSTYIYLSISIYSYLCFYSIYTYSNAPRIPPDVLACYVRAFFGERAI